MLGIIDWGIGGVSIYKLIKQRLGDVGVIYLSDTGVTPYGKMSRSELVDRLNLVIGFLKKKGVTHLVVGCNAASTAIEHLDAQGLRIIGMIESGVAASLKEKPTRLGLIGGRRTVLSGVYRNAFRGKNVEVEQRIAQPLSALIEKGDIGSDILIDECDKILRPIRSCTHILMACTHYPAIEKTMSRFVSPSTVFIDPAQQLLQRVDRWNLIRDGHDRFITTGEPTAMRKAAQNAFGVKIEKVERQIIKEQQ
jgi:glutamate racemase